MAAEMAVVPKAESILVSTGNIVNWNRLKRKAIQSPTEELSDCVGSTIIEWLKNTDKDELQKTTAVQLECKKAGTNEIQSKEERGELKVTVKVFLTEVSTDALREAISTVSRELGVDYLDQVLLSVRIGPLQVEDERDDDFLPMILPLYEMLEELHDAEKVHGIGVSDLDKEKLQSLYEAVKVKPLIDQVNLVSCCVMPPLLVQYAKENDIQLLTHNDPADILPTTTFQDIMKQALIEKDTEGWETSWVVRYSVVVKSRGIIKGKGYLVKGKRDLSKVFKTQ